MELMSSLLLCAFVLMAPRALAHSVMKTDWDTIYNDTLNKRQRPPTHNKILLNINAPPLVNVVSEVQAVFADAACKNCMRCMERAIKAHKINSHVVDSRPSAEEIQADVLADLKLNIHREKRDLKNITTAIKSNKAKSKKNKVHKSVTVTKYNVDGEPYVLKVKETVTQTYDQDNEVKTSSTTCQIYNVKNSFNCDQPEGDMLLVAAKRKANKKNKKDKQKLNVMATTKRIVPLFRKREVDNSQVPENFMPSIEEMY